MSYLSLWGEDLYTDALSIDREEQCPSYGIRTATDIFWGHRNLDAALKDRAMAHVSTSNAMSPNEIKQTPAALLVKSPWSWQECRRAPIVGPPVNICAYMYICRQRRDLLWASLSPRGKSTFRRVQ